MIPIIIAPNKTKTMGLKFFILVLVLRIGFDLNAGFNPINFNCGVGMRLSVDLLWTKKCKNFNNYKLALSMGSAYNFIIKNKIYTRPTIHLDWVFLKGGIGSKEFNLANRTTRNKKNCNSFIAGSLQFLSIGYMGNVGSQSSSYIGKPLYYFSDFTFPVLTNPFNSSVSLGTTYSFNFNEKKIQHIGSISGSILNSTLIYCNDGPPFVYKKILCDGKDRWFTGDGIFNFYDNRRFFNNFEIAYHKFTGWNKLSYETSVDLYLTEVDYKDSTQNLYNMGLISFRLLSNNSNSNLYSYSKHNYNTGIGLNIYDWYGPDIQHLIHFKGYYAHHVSPNPKRIGIVGYGQLNKN